MLRRVLALANGMREAGIPVSVSEEIDALAAVEAAGLERKDRVRSALATTMVKSQRHREAFDVLFSLHFGSGGPETLPGSDTKDGLRSELAAAISAGDASALGDIASRAVDRFGRLENPASGDWYSDYQVRRALDVDGLRLELQRVADEEGPSDLERELRRAEIARRIAAFKTMTLAETRRRVARQRGPEAVARYAVPPVLEELDFLSATADMAEMRKVVRPLARKLATRVALKRRHASRGTADLRRTIRHSLSTGGVPLEIDFRHRPPHRPELVILCDVSSSVARFARFGLMLTHALSSQFTKVRSFAFVDAVDEVTRFFEHEDFVDAVERMNREAEVVSHTGRSDYGEVFETFEAGYGDAVGPKTTLLVLGDARNNYRSRNAWALAALADRAHHSYWLNPEPIHDWDSGDSAASEYAAHVDRMIEVRNIKQLQEFIEREL